MIMKHTTEHTTGPWHVDNKGTEPKISSQDWFIAALFSIHHETEANARLLAAAPDMLEALLGLQEFAEQQVTDLCADIQEGGRWIAESKAEMARWSAVGSAIAKATGKSCEPAS
jgi:hypothetical protein